MTTGVAVPASARRAWSRLSAGPDGLGSFDPVALSGLPAPVARWLAAALTPGAALRRRAELEMEGEIRLGTWRPFTARQLLAPPEGLVWAARARFGPLPVTGYDSLSAGAGQMRWRLLGALPVMSASGPDVTRSAAGRLAGEALLLPPCALAPWVHWRSVDAGRAIAVVAVGGRTHEVTVVVDGEGRLRSMSLPRWGDPDGTGFAERSFGVRLDGELVVGGVRLPGRLTAFWDWDGEGRARGEFFRARLTNARFC